jgi:hypothetical protein
MRCVATASNPPSAMPAPARKTPNWNPLGVAGDHGENAGDHRRVFDERSLTAPSLGARAWPYRDVYRRCLLTCHSAARVLLACALRWRVRPHFAYKREALWMVNRFDCNVDI